MFVLVVCASKSVIQYTEVPGYSAITFLSDVCAVYHYMMVTIDYIVKWRSILNAGLH